MSLAVSGELLLLGILWPLFSACLLLIPALRAVALALAPWAALPALLVTLLTGPDELHLHLGGVLLGADLGLDATGRIFLLFTALLWLVAGMFARGYFPGHEQRRGFYLFFLLAMTGNFALVAALDVLSFYLGFALMSFASYGLVIFSRSGEALRAGRVYMVMVVAGELMLFVALLMAAHKTGSTSFDAIRASLSEADSLDLIILLALGGFGIKAGVFGFHVWLPLAHPVAPTPASAVLSGAMIKAGLLGWLRLLPLGDASFPAWGAGFLILGLITAFYAVGVGLVQRDPKTVLAYSSVSKMGVITTAIGLGLLAPQTWALLLPTILFYAMHHGLNKGALFLGIGLADKGYRLRGWVWVAMLLPALALAGAPWTSGMLAKTALKMHFLELPEPWMSWLPALLSVSSVATALLMARLLYLVRPVTWVSTTPPSRGMLLPWLALLVCIAFMPWWSVAWADAPLGVSVLDGGIFDSLWPVLLGIGLTAILLFRGPTRTPIAVPAGDMLIPLERGWLRTSGALQRLINSLRGCCVRNGRQVHVAGQLDAAAVGLRLAENGMSHWRVAGLLIVASVLVVAVIATTASGGSG